MLTVFTKYRLSSLSRGTILEKERDETDIYCIYNVHFFNLAATHRPGFLSGVFKILGCMYAELAHRLLGENWVYACALPPSLGLSLGSTQGTGSQLSRASPMPSLGVMPLPGVEM